MQRAGVPGCALLPWQRPALPLGSRLAVGGGVSLSTAPASRAPLWRLCREGDVWPELQTPAPCPSRAWSYHPVCR